MADADYLHSSKQTEHRLALKKSSNQKLIEDIENVMSGYENDESAEPYSFCSGTISWYNNYLRYYTHVVIFFVICCVFLNSYIIVFNYSLSTSGFGDLADLLYIILMFLRSRTGHLIDGVEERNLLKVRERYQTSVGFFLDLMTILPFSFLRYILPGEEHWFYVIDKQKIYLRLHYVLYYIGCRQEEPGSSTVKFRTTLYITLSSIVIHFSALGFYGISCANAGYGEFRISMCRENSWLYHHLLYKIHDRLNINLFKMEEDVTDEVRHLVPRYVISLYWAAHSSFSTGFGDVHAFTITEKVFSVFAMLIGMAFLYGMAVSGITSMLLNADARRASFVHYYDAFKGELENMHVREQVKGVCSGYCDYIWHRFKGLMVHEMGTLDILPDCLHGTFTEYAFKPLLDGASLLKGSQGALCRKLARVSKHRIYLKNRYVQRAGEIADAMCYVHRGSVQILDQSEKNVIDTISEGECFGEVFLLFDLPRLNTIKCLTDCELLWLDKHAFAEVIVDYPEASDQIKDAIRERCKASCRWPLDIPTLSDSVVLERIMKGHRHSIVEDITEDSIRKIKNYQKEESPSENVPGVVRMTEVADMEYDGIGLSRVTFCNIGGDGNHSAAIEDDDSNKVCKQMTLFQRIEEATICHTNGKFYRFWERYITALSLFAFLFQTTMFCMNIIIRRVNPCAGTCLDNLPVLDVAVDMEDDENMIESLQVCETESNMNGTIGCILGVGGLLSERITGNLTTGYVVDIPWTWDVSIMGLNVETVNGWIHLIISYLIIDLSLWLNIFINMRTVIRTTTGEVTSFRDIGKYYLTFRKFGIDLLYVFPFEILAPTFSMFKMRNRAGKHVWWLLLRNNRLFCIFRYFPRNFGKWKRSLTANIVRIKLTYVILICFCIVHTICVWLPWSRCSYMNQDWSHEHFGKAGTYSESCQKILDYSQLFYVCSMTITSTGYGEYPATVTDLMLMAIMTMTLGTIMCGWIIAVISSMISSTASAVTTYSNDLLMMKRYLLKHAVPLQLTNRALDCRYILWDRFLGDATPGEGRDAAIDSKLPLNLHQMLMYESFGSFIERIPLFKGLHPAAISKLCNNIDAYHYSEGMVVIYEGDMCGGLYIIKQGHCVVVTDDLTESFDVLHPGDYFGEVEIFYGKGSARTVVADTSVEILFLKKVHIIDIIATFPSINSQIAKIGDNKEYHDMIVQNIHRRTDKPRVDMSKRFDIHHMSGGVSYYGDKIVEAPAVWKMTNADNNDDVYVHPVLKSLAQLFLLPFTFDPGSKLYIYYETFRMILVIITLIIVPIQAAYMPNIPALLALQYILDGLAMVDQYIKLHTMYYNDRKVLVCHPLYTAGHYFKTSFFVDFISWFPFDLIVMAAIPTPWTLAQWRFICMFRILRILQLYKLINYFNYWQSDVRWRRRFLKHCTRIIYTILMHNSVACVMYMTMAQPQIKWIDNTNNSDYMTLTGAAGPFSVPKESWVAKAIIDDAFPALDLVNSTFHRYLLSLYYVTATLVSVGYGDVVAAASIEKLFCSILMYLGIIYYALILGDIAATIQMDDTTRAVFKKRMMDIRNFFKLNHVSKETTNQVIDFYSYLWERTGGITPNDLFRGLPPNIRASLYHCMYDEMIRESFQTSDAIANSNISEKDINRFFNLLSMYVHPQIFLAKTIIFSRNSVGEDMYFLQRGNVAILEEDDETVKRVLGPGQYFGEIALFSSIPRTATVVAMTNCDLSVINKQDLSNILDRYPQFREIMTTIALDRRLKGTTSTSYVRRKSITDQFSNANVYDEKGNRNDGQDKFFFSKIIDRNSTFAQIWDHGTVILAFLSSSLAVYQACFLTHNSGIDTFVFLMDVWFAIDMVICFHTSYFDKMGDIVETLEKIHAHYGKDWRRFFIDCVTNFPFEVFVHFVPMGGTMSETYARKLAILSYLRLNRVLRMRKFFAILATWERDLQKDTLLVRMYKLVLVLFYIINLFSSVFYFVACPGGSCVELSWTTMPLTDYKNKGVRGEELLPWVDGCYWTVATMTSTGYGDIRPRSVTEISFAMCVMVAGKVLIGYILSMLAATLANDDARKVWYEEQVNAVKTYMTDMKFDKTIFDHIEQYYDYIWMKNQGAKFSELFNDLCYSLKADIMYQLVGSDVERNELFNGCSINFIRHVCSLMRSVSYMPSDYICLQDDVRSDMFVIHRGVAEIFKQDEKGKNIPIRLMMDGETFLSECALRATRLSFSVRARTYVDVYTLSKDDLKTCIESYPFDGDILRQNAASLHPTLA
ncbi:uncharacterized protein LOC120347089 isoform X1 [Styela clava]